jgi:hypothetical protein
MMIIRPGRILKLVVFMTYMFVSFGSVYWLYKTIIAFCIEVLNWQISSYIIWIWEGCFLMGVLYTLYKTIVVIAEDRPWRYIWKVANWEEIETKEMYSKETTK